MVAAAALALQNAADPWPAQDVVAPADLAREIQKGGDRVLLHVGFSTLYRSVHITGSKYAGPGRTSAGIEELKKALADVPRSKEVVLYCGCCPWTQCPNIRPAYKAAREMGFTRVRVLSIPTNLHKDWTEKGYPVERAAAERD